MMQLVELFTGAEQFSQELRIGQIFFPDYPTCLCTFPTVTGFLRIEKQLLGGGGGLAYLYTVMLIAQVIHKEAITKTMAWRR